jgi:hypothetical protein
MFVSGYEIIHYAYSYWYRVALAELRPDVDQWSHHITFKNLLRNALVRRLYIISSSH